jgi:hypothetical protein
LAVNNNERCLFAKSLPNGKQVFCNERKAGGCLRACRRGHAVKPVLKDDGGGKIEHFDAPLLHGGCE